MSRLSEAPPQPDAAGVVDELRELGFTQYEARIYGALVRAQVATAAELSRETGVPRPKTYEALSVLARRGFAATRTGKITRYRALPPEQALAAWVDQRDQERMSRSQYERSVAQRLVAQLPKVELPDDRTPAEYVEAITGRSRVTGMLERLLGEARERICYISRPPFLQPRSRWNEAEVEAHRRGVLIRVIFSDDALEDRQRWLPLVEAGIEVRSLPLPPMKLLTIDDRIGMMSHRDWLTGEQDVVATLVRHVDLVGSLCLLFDEQWQAAKPVRAR